MILALLLWLAFLAGACLIGGLLTDSTNLGAGLAAGVKGRPFVPIDTQE